MNVSEALLKPITKLEVAPLATVQGAAPVELVIVAAFPSIVALDNVTVELPVF